MPRLNLEQGTSEWHSYRECHVMATSASVIMEINPFKTELELWEEMIGLRPRMKSNVAMERGTRLEPEARRLANQIIGIEFEPCVYESDKYNWMGASLDGISKCEKYILEIKCPNEKTHEMALNEMIPEYYIAQIQHQLAVTNARLCYYFSYRPENIKKYAIVEIERNDEFIEKMIAKENAFWINLCTMQPPEEIWKFKK